MTKYDILINGNKYEVEITYDDGTRATVKVNGKEYDVEARSVSSVVAPVAVQTPQTPSSPAPASPAPAAKSVEHPTVEGELAIRAPMPGVVLDVSVSVGQSVKPGEVVMRIEAMKMENDIKSHVEGKVKEIMVGKGQDVQENDVLLVLEG